MKFVVPALCLKGLLPTPVIALLIISAARSAQLPSPHRAWEDVPAAKKTLWEKHRSSLQSLDLSNETSRQIIIAQGTPQAYHAHPTTTLLADNKTLLAIWNIGHGGHAGPIARSEDGGVTWRRLDDTMPPNYWNFKNCPSIYRVIDPAGKERLWIFAARTLSERENPKEIPGRLEGYMPRLLSEDEGHTWRELQPLGERIAMDNPFRNVMTFSSIVRLRDGSSLGMFHRGDGLGEGGTLQVMQSITRDGGFTWSAPVIAADGHTLAPKLPCEPYVFRSPDGDELCCIMRENKRTGTSLVMFSRDEGKTWSTPVDTPWGLSGDRHHGLRLPDGRLVIVFRNAAPFAPARLVAWIGTYDDIRRNQPGQYRIGLLRTYKDGFYPGLHRLPDGTIIATTYTTLKENDGGCSIVSVRFTAEEIDQRFARQ
jgi:hypothetical protein